MSYALAARAKEKDVTPARPNNASTSLRISQPNDSLEQEAEDVANKMMRGDRTRNWSLSKAQTSQVQRQGATTPPTQSNVAPQQTDFSSIAGKLAEAFLKTDLGKKLTDAVKQDELVKGATDFVGTLPGKVVAGTLAAGTVTGLAAAHKALPVQIPEIPLDAIKPGLKVKLNYEGPVDHPTQATVTFSYTPQADKKKSAQTDSERQRAANATIAADQEKFRTGLQYPPGSPQNLEQKAEQKAVQDYVNSRLGALPGLGGRPLGAQTPAAGAPETGLELPGFRSPFQRKTPTLFDKQLELKPLSSVPDASAKKKEESAPQVQRKAEQGASDHAGLATAAALPHSGGHPLDQITRTLMESRFGFDFSKIRIHTDSDAAESAKGLNALAYTIGKDLVFGAGQYSPQTEEGRRLIAHELTHTIQQQPDERAKAAYAGPGRVSRSEAPARTIQRKCACGGSDRSQDDCEECKKGG